jgi:hypothetical protein
VEQAFNMAGDALFAWCDAFSDLPQPTDINSIKLDEGDFVQLVKAVPYDEVNECQKKRVANEIESGLKEKGYTKNQAAIILGVDRSYITKITNGTKTPAPDMAKRIGLLLGFDWRIFYGDEARI